MNMLSATSVLFFYVLFAAFSPATSQCTEFTPIDETDRLDDFDTIVADVDNDCFDGVDATFTVPSKVNFKLYEATSSRTQFSISTSPPELIVPYVQNRQLRFKWNHDRPNDDTGNDQAGIQVMFKSTVKSVETGFGTNLQNLGISIASTNLQKITNNGDGNMMSINQFGGTTLIYKTTSNGATAEIFCGGNVTIDIGGSSDQKTSIAARSISGVMTAHGSETRTVGPTAITTTGLGQSILVNDENGCDNWTDQGFGNLCAYDDTIDVKPRSIPCLGMTTGRTMVCGTGINSSAKIKLFWQTFMIAAISVCYLL